jgi:cytidine deaminase
MAHITRETLIKSAREQLRYSYSPYSRYATAAALLGADGVIYTGCNVENASLAATVCAERTAVVKAVSRGCRSFSAIAIVGAKGGLCVPCGTCRQVLAEFSPDLTVILEDDSGQIVTYKLCDLLPSSFNLRMG